MFNVYRIHQTMRYVFWLALDPSDNTHSDVYRCPFGGCEPGYASMTFIDGPHADFFPNDDGGTCFADPGINNVECVGGNGDGLFVITGSNTLTDPASIAIRNELVYFSANPMGGNTDALGWVDEADDSGAPTYAANIGKATGIVATARGIAFIDELNRVALRNDDGGVVTLGGDGARVLASDESFVYYGTSLGEIYRVPLSAGEAQRLTAGLTRATYLEVDGTGIYGIDETTPAPSGPHGGSLGSVFVLAKP
jgi:hypothetical protein